MPHIEESESHLPKRDLERLADQFEALALVQTGSGGGAVGRYAFAPVGSDVGPRSSGAAPYSVRLRKPDGECVLVDLRVYHQALLFDPVETGGGGELSAVYDTLPGFDWERRFERLQVQLRASLFVGEPADDESQPIRAPSVPARLLAVVSNGAERACAGRFARTPSLLLAVRAPTLTVCMCIALTLHLALALATPRHCQPAPASSRARHTSRPTPSRVCRHGVHGPRRPRAGR